MLLPSETNIQTPEDSLYPGGEAVRRVFEKVREYEELLNSIPEVSEDEKAAIINSLDAEWPYYGQTLKVSGNVLMGGKLEEPTEQDGDTDTAQKGSVSYETGKRFIEDMQLTSLGFNYYERPVVVGGEAVGQERVIGLYFHVSDDLIAPNMLLSQFIRVSAIGGLDDIAIEYPENTDDLLPSVSYFFPEAAEDIDCAVLNAADEVDATERLGKVAIAVHHDVTPEALGLLSRYASSMVEFDQRVPYDVAFEGLFYKVDADEDGDPYLLTPLVTTTPIEWWAYPRSIEIIPSAIPRDGQLVADDSQRAFGLRLAVLSKEGRDEAMATVVIPLTDDFAMASVRKVYYADKQS